MTPQQLYQKVLNEEMSQSQFLFQIRRDDGLSSFITNTNTYDQTIVQLKNRGHIFDINEAKEETFDLLGSIKVLTEATKKPKLDQDHANDYEFQQGWRYELDDMKEPDIDKAREKALKNIESDPIYYTRLLLLKTKKPTKRTDQPIEINAGKTNVVDKDNAVKPVKGIEKDKKTPKGSAEKATKPKGVKTMKGGPGEMKTVSEGKNPFPGNKLKGGKGDKLSINDVDRAEFKKGIKHEMEHTTDPKIAAEIALDHLAENPKYYSELDKTGIDESIFSSVDKPVKGKEVSFTVEDHSDPNKKLQIKKTVKSGKKSKDGTFELSFTQGDKLTMTKTNQGVTSLYFENPSDAKIHDKVVDLDKGLATLADKIFPKEQEKTVNEYADGEKDDYDEIEDSYGTPEIKSMLNKYDNLGFDLPGEAMNAILTDKDFTRNYDFDNNQPDVQKLTAWRDSIVKKKKAHEALRESLKKIIRKKLYEQDIKGPTVKKNELNDLMKRYDWYYETSDNESLKKRGQETHDKAMDLVNQLGDAGIEVFNSYAPDDCKISKTNESYADFKTDKKSLPGGWKVLQAKDKPGKYGIYMTDKKDSYYFDMNPERDTDEYFNTEAEAIKNFWYNAETDGTDINHWMKKHPESKNVNEGRATKKITVLADDAEGTIENILKALQGRGNGGHSFSVTVDEDGEDGGDKFGWDGDGSDYIEDIKVETLPKDDKKQ